LLVLAAPVTTDSGARPGVLAGVMVLRATSLFAWVGAERRSETAVDLVIDRRGMLLSHPREERLLGDAADEPGLREVITQWRAAGSPVEPNGIARLSEGHLVSMAGIPHTEWMHLRVTPESVAMQPVAAARHEALVAAIAAGVLAALLSGALAWVLVRP